MKIGDYEKHRNKGLKWFKKKAWDNFSLFIRLRDTNTEGYGKCCTCNEYKFYKNADAGHYISRKELYIDEINVNLQCKPCNGFQGGRRDVYKEFLIAKHGEDIIDFLKVRAKLSGNKTRFEWFVIAVDYEEKYKELLKTKIFYSEG